MNGNGVKLVGIKAVAELLGVCTRTVRRLCESGEFPQPVRLGRSLRWPLSDIERLIESREGAKA